MGCGEIIRKLESFEDGKNGGSNANCCDRLCKVFEERQDTSSIIWEGQWVFCMVLLLLGGCPMVNPGQNPSESCVFADLPAWTLSGSRVSTRLCLTRSLTAICECDELEMMQ